MKVIIQELIEFCNDHNNIFLYGAGLHAEILFELLSQNNIRISGFITTNKEKDNYYNLPVYSVDEYIRKVPSAGLKKRGNQPYL